MLLLCNVRAVCERLQDVGGEDRPISDALLRQLAYVTPNESELRRLTGEGVVFFPVFMSFAPDASALHYSCTARAHAAVQPATFSATLHRRCRNDAIDSKQRSQSRGLRFQNQSNHLTSCAVFADS